MSARRSGADVVHHGAIPAHGGTRNRWSFRVDALFRTGLVEIRVIHEINFVGEQFAEERCFGPRALRFGWLGWLGQLGLHACDRRERGACWAEWWSRTASTTAGHLSASAAGSCLRKATVAVHDAVG